MQVSKKLTVLTLLVAASLGSYAQDSSRSAATKATNAPAFQTVKGVVTEASTGKPLRGIRATYKSTYAAISDSNGTFTIKVPSLSVTILLEGEGFQSKEVAIHGESSIKASLYEDTFNSFYDVSNLP